MACPFFDPAAPFTWVEWPNPPRMPLGDPHRGKCTVEDRKAPDPHERTCCNTGYARGQCPSFPGGNAPDAVRFGIVSRREGVATLEYVIERNHYPFEHGELQLRETAPASSDITLVERQARAFLSSYLRRNS